MTVNFITFGCKVNQYESESMREELLNKGFSAADETADIFIINSCTVTKESDRKTKKTINRIRREHPNSVIVLTGCLPQSSPKIAEALDVDIVLGNTEKRDLAGAISAYLKNKQKTVIINKHEKEEAFAKYHITKFADRSRAYIKIEDGCNRGCTYCIIPKARGRIRSRSLSEIKEESVRLSNAGFKEIVLVGINLSSYQFGLANAVKAAASANGIKRVRLGSLEPDLTTKELLLALKEIPEFCPQFHLALQSGCDNTLKRMNRLYTTREFTELTKTIREIFKDASFTTDIMVGFAGETQEDFKESCEFVKKTGFLHCHIFPYSVREGTFAANYKNQLTKAQKEERAKKMKEVCEQVSLKERQKYIGLTKEVLLETDGSGYTKEYLRVYLNDYKENSEDFSEQNNFSGDIINVKILSVFKDGVKAEKI